MLLMGDFVVNALSTIFLQLLDTLAYTLVSIAYFIFCAVSKINIFSSDGAGGEIFADISKAFYTIISVIVVFVFAYYLITMILDPDDNSKVKSGTGLVKNILISIGIVVLLPVIFDYMYIFQTHIIDDNTIGALILGSSANSDETKTGSGVAMMTLASFYHPVDSDYSDFFDNSGNLLNQEKAVKNCVGERDGNKIEKTCTQYYGVLSSWSSSGNHISSITGNDELRKKIGKEDGMEYMWIISTICGVVVAWFFISYAIDLGTRAVKLGFLQLIAPVPVMLRIIPKMEKSFNEWFKQIKNTYIDVFFRLMVIFFIVKLCSLVPGLMNVIFDEANDNITGIAKPIAMVAVLLGLLKFAKDAPELVKTLFSTGAFGSLNLKPGVRGRVTSNEYAMRGLSGAGGLVFGGITSAVKQGRKRYNEIQTAEGGTGNKTRGLGRSVLQGARGLVRGGVSSAYHGVRSKPETFRKLGTSVIDASARGNASADRMITKPTDIIESAETRAGNVRERFQNIGRYFDPNQTTSSSTAVAASDEMLSGIKQITETMKKCTETITNNKNEALTQLSKEGKTLFEGIEFNINPTKTGISNRVFNADGTRSQRMDLYQITTKDGTFYCDKDGNQIAQDDKGVYHYVDSTGKIVDQATTAKNLRSESYQYVEQSIKDAADKSSLQKLTKEYNDEMKKNLIKQQATQIGKVFNRHYDELGKTNMDYINKKISEALGKNVTAEEFLNEFRTSTTFTENQVKAFNALEKSLGAVQNNAKIAAVQEAQAKAKDDK